MFQCITENCDPQKNEPKVYKENKLFFRSQKLNDYEQINRQVDYLETFSAPDKSILPLNEALIGYFYEADRNYWNFLMTQKCFFEDCSLEQIDVFQRGCAVSSVIQIIQNNFDYWKGKRSIPNYNLFFEVFPDNDSPQFINMYHLYVFSLKVLQEQQQNILEYDFVDYRTKKYLETLFDSLNSLFNEQSEFWNSLQSNELVQKQDIQYIDKIIQDFSCVKQNRSQVIGKLHFYGLRVCQELALNRENKNRELLKEEINILINFASTLQHSIYQISYMHTEYVNYYKNAALVIFLSLSLFLTFIYLSLGILFGLRKRTQKMFRKIFPTEISKKLL